MNIMVQARLEERDRERLRQAAPGENLVFGWDPDFMPCAEVVLGQLKPEDFRMAGNLRWLQLNSAGADPYLAPGVLPAGVTLTNVTGAFGLAISEYMVGVTMMLTKKLHLYRDNMAKELWLDRGNVPAIEDMTVLTVGLGDIGGNYAKRMKALGAKTLGVRRTERAVPDYMDAVCLPEGLDKILPQADIVALAMPNTSETRKMFNRNRLSAMKPGAFLINVGRGNAVDCEALAEQLGSGRLGGAALDVTDPEPLPQGHPLWRCENALITPHISGFYHVHRTYERVADIFVENLRRYVTGKPLKNVVDPATGYCRKDEIG